MTSALASSEAGILTPNAFAALRVMTSTAQVVVDGNGLRQQLAIGQQEKQRVPAQIKFSTHPLCFDFSTTDAETVAGGSLPESCPKNGDLPKSPLLSTGSAGAIGWHISNLKVDLGLHCGCRRHPHSGNGRL